MCLCHQVEGWGVSRWRKERVYRSEVGRESAGGEGICLFLFQRRQSDGVGMCVLAEGGGEGGGRINTGEDSSAREDRQCFVSRLINRAKCICSLPNLSEDAERRRTRTRTRRTRRMGRGKKKEREPFIRELLVVRYLWSMPKE